MINSLKAKIDYLEDIINKTMIEKCNCATNNIIEKEIKNEIVKFKEFYKNLSK